MGIILRFTFAFFITLGLTAQANAKVERQYKEDLSDPKKLETLTKDLEAVYLNTMLNPLFPKGNKSGLYGGGNSSNIYRSMMIQEYSKIISKQGGVGLARQMNKQLQSNRNPK
tara:strand:+ start:116 stop:454 length:339 start_codon:yes stop_codon:yes gene_type:complete